jgi:hypothetical protein
MDSHLSLLARLCRNPIVPGRHNAVWSLLLTFREVRRRISLGDPQLIVEDDIEK